MPVTGNENLRPSLPHTNWIVYAAFMATGLGVVLPGAILPLLLSRWSMNDGQAGILFFLFFVGTTSGALLSRGSMPSSIVRGCMATTAGAFALAQSSRTVAFGAILLYGLGLGLVMTSVSLLQSRRDATNRLAEMARLNLIWATGACLGPWITLRGSAVSSPKMVLYCVATIFALQGSLVFVLVRCSVVETVVVGSWRRQLRAASIPLLLMVPFATGIESSAGGWIAAYSKRSGQTLDGIIGAATCFWAGMLLSRFVQSHERISKASVLLFNPWLVVVALSLLLTTPRSGPVISVAALLVGWGIGPIYPLLLALILKHGEGGNTVFLMAGSGAAVLPLLTGLTSSWTGSLRAGLGIPLVGAMTMACFGRVMAKEKHSSYQS